jgi:hypothetical protein
MAAITLLSEAVDSSLRSCLDEDTCEYIQSLLEEDLFDADAREAVSALIEGSIGGEDLIKAEQVTADFFGLLDASAIGSDTKENAFESVETVLRRLDHAVTIKDKDVQTFASGLQADMDTTELDKESDIAAFYANMIDVTNNAAAVSERARRKERQREIRLAMEEEERKRCIEEAMAMLENTETASTEKMMERSVDNAQDVHFKNLVGRGRVEDLSSWPSEL